MSEEVGILERRQRNGKGDFREMMVLSK